VLTSFEWGNSFILGGISAKLLADGSKIGKLSDRALIDTLLYRSMRVYLAPYSLCCYRNRLCLMSRVVAAFGIKDVATHFSFSFLLHLDHPIVFLNSWKVKFLNDPGHLLNIESFYWF
jgi:hypothetical protein